MLLERRCLIGKMKKKQHLYFLVFLSDQIEFFAFCCAFFAVVVVTLWFGAFNIKLIFNSSLMLGIIRCCVKRKKSCSLSTEMAKQINGSVSVRFWFSDIHLLCFVD